MKALYPGMLSLAIAFAAPRTVAGETLVIAGGTVLTQEGRAALAADVVVEDGKIVEVVEHASRPGARTFDAHGLFVVPGLIDDHIHCSLERYGDLLLANGVTTVRDMGNPL